MAKKKKKRSAKANGAKSSMDSRPSDDGRFELSEASIDEAIDGAAAEEPTPTPTPVSLSAEGKAMFVEAMNRSTGSLTNPGDNADAHCQLGTMLTSARFSDDERAERSFLAAINSDPGHIEAHLNLGELLAKRSDTKGAEAAFRAAIRADPNQARGWTRLGRLLFENKFDHDGAEAAFRAAVKADPNSYSALFELGHLLHRVRNDLDGAESAYCAALLACPGHASAHHCLADLLNEREPAEYELSCRVMEMLDDWRAGEHRPSNALVQTPSQVCHQPSIQRSQYPRMPTSTCPHPCPSAARASRVAECC